MFVTKGHLGGKKGMMVVRGCYRVRKHGLMPGTEGGDNGCKRRHVIDAAMTKFLFYFVSVSSESSWSTKAGHLSSRVYELR